MNKNCVTDFASAAAPAETNLPSNAKFAPKILQKGMASYRCMHNADFRNIVEKHENLVEESMHDSVDLIFIDPLYNVHQDCESKNTDHDQFSNDVIKFQTSFCREKLKKAYKVI